MKSKFTMAALSMAFALMASAQKTVPVYLNPDAPVEARVQDALKRAYRSRESETNTCPKHVLLGRRAKVGH